MNPDDFIHPSEKGHAVAARAAYAELKKLGWGAKG